MLDKYEERLLSIEALEWLRSVNYSDKSHEERKILMVAAKIAYPYGK